MNIKFVVFDFDGIFTDGKIIFDNEGKVMKHYHSKDGMGISRLKDSGFEIGVISGWPNNKSQQSVLNHLNIKRVSLGSNQKLKILKKWCEELKYSLNEVAYMGDDLNDIEVMKQVGFVACPNDSIEDVKEISDLVCEKCGGKGAVREFCDYLINLLDKKTIVGLICVKFNSSRLPYKNFRKFGNETLLDIKIKKLLKLKFLNKVIINTESEFIINYIKNNYSNNRLKIVKRDIKYALDKTDNRDFCRNVVESIEEEYILYSPVTMPFIKFKTYNEGFKILCKGDYDSIILNADGIQGSGHIHEKHKLCFGFSMMKKNDILNYGDFIGKNPYYLKCSIKERIDIDFPDEFNLALYHYFNNDSIYGNENLHSLKINSLYNLNDISPIEKYKNTNISKKFKEVKIIDVTIRDGGFDNKWNWNIDEVKYMLKCISETGIEFFEIGYLNNENILKPEDGHFRNVSFETINKIVKEIKPKCKISVLFDAWRYDTEKLPYRTEYSVDLVRVVTYMDDDKLLKAIEQCKRVKEKGYLVSLNIMCASYFTDDILQNIKDKITKNISVFNYIYFADSYGGMEPKYVDYIFSYIKSIKNIKSDIQIGFHIHNNGQIGMANMIKSLDYVDIIDASFYGMGRGMGNVRLEDVVLFLKIKRNYSFDLEPFLNYLSLNGNETKKEDIKNTIVGFLNIHPYRIRDFKDQDSLYKLYCLLKNLPKEKKYDYLV